MSAQDAPDALLYVIEIRYAYSKERKPLPEKKGPRGIFARKAGANHKFSASGSNLEVAEGALDFSTAAAALAAFNRMKREQEEKLEKILTPREADFNYTEGVSGQFWIGKREDFRTRPSNPSALWSHCGDCTATPLQDAEVTADNIAKVISRYDTAEARQRKKEAVDAAIDAAVAPPEQVKAMKPLKLKGGAP